MAASMATRRLAPAALLVAALACADSPEPAPDVYGDTTRGTMATILQALEVALPLSLSEERFTDPANQQAVEGALTTLAASATTLEAHGRQGDASFAYLSRALARDTREALSRFESHQAPESRFLVQQMVEVCVACHSRVPSGDSALGGRFFQDIDTTGLGPTEMLRLELATRQFDAAMESYERLFASPEVSPQRLDIEGLFTDYLVLSIRVKGDLERPQTTLARFAERSDVPRYLKRELDAWQRELQELRSNPPLGTPVQQARALIEEGERRTRVPADRTGLVHEVEGTRILYEYVSSEPGPSEQLAEAYYLLGVAESAISRSYWLSQADFYLETAIRMAPHTEVAGNAFDLLEQQTLAGYTGSSGLHVPEHVLEHLDELRELSTENGAPGPASP